MSMSTIIETIQNWPVIIQGALGSALFALVMYLGEKVFSAAPALASRLSRTRRRSYLITKAIRLRAKTSKDPLAKAYYPAMLWYRASRDVIKGLIWLTLGLIFTNMVGVFGVIGHLGCLYYLFFALEVVKPIKGDSASIEAQLVEINQRLKDLRESQPT